MCNHHPIDLYLPVKGVSIRDSSATAGASTFLSTNDVTGERLFEGNDLTDAAKPFNAKTSFTLYGNLIPETKAPEKKPTEKKVPEKKN